MNCSQVRTCLPAWLYGELPSEKGTEIQAHLASCLACQAEEAALRDVRRLLDLVPAPAIAVDVPRLYREAGQRQQRHGQRWRRTALVLGAAAALLAGLAFLSRLEVRLESHQVVLRWGAEPSVPSPDPAPTSTPIEPPPPPTPVMVSVPQPQAPDERLPLLADLVQALAAEMEKRDDQQNQDLAALRNQVLALQQQIVQMRIANDRDLAAVYTALFPPDKKGPSQ